MKTTLKQIGIILLFSGVVSVFANWVHPRKIPWVADWSSHVEAKARDKSIPVIPLSVALKLFQASETVFIDARPVEEFDAGHIRGALSAPLNSWEDQFMVLASLVDSQAPLVLYCSNRECDDALTLAILLQPLGATNMSVYVDGFDLWEKHGGEVE